MLTLQSSGTGQRKVAVHMGLLENISLKISKEVGGLYDTRMAQQGQLLKLLVGTVRKWDHSFFMDL
ncbi:mCG13665 [Mus musculus]|jgi:hypothetical protein|uniref:Putative per-hexamer repeat protein 2 n=1 Tax=Mus musculus TaxID=10090 RepID=PHXR2_MOUSE|nr:RecName: Full=Putative per-hexamer repeat protein 2 [Mus musculus]AAI19391.1 Per-hexamer repeat gene 2 [Mus musculus]AAI19393.1 Per-hexamer repeat gene 2 [Mus musculus]EDL21645.1 mCG13665 [Mus musculus]CAB42648.1 unnamed protein product [Mus musculus]